MKDQPESRRRHPRFAVEDLVVALDSGGAAQTVPISLINVSLSGAAISATQPLGAIGESFAIVVRALPEDTPIRLPCEIRYLMDENKPAGAARNWLYGVCFHGLSWHARYFVEQFVRNYSPMPPH